MQELKPIKEGKVREIYDNGDSLIMVATDRISCFDEIIQQIDQEKDLDKLSAWVKLAAKAESLKDFISRM